MRTPLLIVLPTLATLAACTHHRASNAPAPTPSSPTTTKTAPATTSPLPPNNQELADLFTADQTDRQGAIDWHEVSLRDEAREKRVREMLTNGDLKSPRDYYHAAMIFQHSSEGDGMNLAHELAMISAALGDKNARWLMAASYDRLLGRLGQPQRFATQYAGKDGPPTLSPVLPGVTDAMRAALRVPTLEQAKAREAEIQRTWQQVTPSH